MDNTLSPVITQHCKSKYSNSSVYSGVDEQHNNYNSSSTGSQADTGIWSRGQKLVRLKCNSFWRHCRLSYNIFCRRFSCGLDTRNNIKSSRLSRANRRNNRLDYKYYYYLALCLLSVTPILADEPEVNNTSNPVAAATGNVTNQAVQFQNNGAASRQQYAPGVVCNGSTMTFSPFYMGNHTNPYSEKEDMEGLHPSSYQLNENWGFQINFMVPLDKSGYKQCKEIAKRQEEKLRLDYELVRALKCAELQTKGFTLRPGSRVEHMCYDIVPIQSLLPPKPKEKKFKLF